MIFLYFAIDWVQISIFWFCGLSQLTLDLLVLTGVHSFFNIPLLPHTLKLWSYTSDMFKNLPFNWSYPQVEMLLFYLLYYLIDEFEMILIVTRWNIFLPEGITARVKTPSSFVFVILVGKGISDTYEVATLALPLRKRFLSQFSRVIIRYCFDFLLLCIVDSVVILVNSGSLTLNFAILKNRDVRSFESSPVMGGERWNGDLGRLCFVVVVVGLIGDVGFEHDFVLVVELSPRGG